MDPVCEETCRDPRVAYQGFCQSLLIRQNVNPDHGHKVVVQY